MELIHQSSISPTDIMALSASHRVVPSYESEMKQFVKSGSNCLGDTF